MKNRILSRRPLLSLMATGTAAALVIAGITTSANAYETGHEVNLNQTKATSGLNIKIVFGKDKNLQQNVAMVNISGTNINGGFTKTAPYDIAKKRRTGNLTKSFTYEAKQSVTFPDKYGIEFFLDNSAHFGGFAPKQDSSEVTVLDAYSSSVGFNLGHPITGGGHYDITRTQTVSYKQEAFRTRLEPRKSNYLGWNVDFNKFRNEKLEKLVDINDPEVFLATKVGHKGNDVSQQQDMLLNANQLPALMTQFIPEAASEIIAEKGKDTTVFAINLKRESRTYLHTRNNHSGTAWDGGAYTITGKIDPNPKSYTDTYRIEINWKDGTAKFI